LHPDIREHDHIRRDEGSADMDIALLARNWWIIALRGAASIVFGILMLLMPGIGLMALVLLFGSYAIVEGVLNVVAAVRGRRHERRWGALLLEGLVSIAAGLIAFVMPGLTALALVYIIAAWAVVTGVLEIVAAVRLRHEIIGEWWLALSGAASIAFGVLMMVFPGAGAIALVLWVGAYALVFGALLLFLAFRLRRWHDEERVTLRRAA
jgi:uncharacterized membrane protein HdeD (DUF308 family)